MPRLKIAMLSIHSCPLGQLGSRDTGGMNVYVRELARHLGALGHQVDIFTRAHDPRDAVVEQPYPGVRLIHIRAGRVEDMGKMAQLEHLAEFAANMAAFAAADGAVYDLVHSHYWLSGLVGQRFAAARGVPHVVMFHTLGAIKNSLPVGEVEPEVRLAVERDIARACWRIVAATPGEMQQLEHHYGVPSARVSVVPCGVNAELFQPFDRFEARRRLGLSAQDDIILSVGRIEPLKGLDRLIEAVAMIRRPNLKLLILGGDEHSEPEVARLRVLAGELGVADRVTFPGTVKQDVLPLYYSAASVTAVASYYESFCLVILESLACGTPVVSTDVGVAPMAIRDGVNGSVVYGNEASGLARGLEKTLASALQRADAIRASALPYSWPIIAGRIAAVYQAALKAASISGRLT